MRAQVYKLGRKRGIASVLAMLFLCLFATLAVGFYGSVTTSVQLSNNERRSGEADFAAESGLQFITYHLVNLTAINSSDLSVVFSGIQTQLATRLNGYQNMYDAAGTLHNMTRIDNSDGTSVLCIPGHSTVNSKTVYNWMRLGTNSGSTCMFIKLDIRSGVKVLTVTALGKSSGTNPAYRALQYDLKANSSTNTVSAGWQAPNGSIVTYSPISASNGVTISGSVTAVLPVGSTIAPASVTGGARIVGNLTYANTTGTPTINNGGSVTGTITKTTTPPTPPTIDTSVFSQFVPASSATGSQVIKSGSSTSNLTVTNIRIKANTNPTFSNSVLNGVIYIESPNKVTFAGGSKLNGVVATDTSVAYSVNNQITINNGTTMNGVTSINMATVPSGEVAHVQALQNMFTTANGSAVNASMILAPNYGLSFQGGMTISGASAIVGSQFNIANGSAISLSGVLMSLNNTTTPFTVAGGMTISSSGTPQSWPGLSSAAVTTSSTSVALNRTTYSETSPWPFLQ